MPAIKTLAACARMIWVMVVLLLLNAEAAVASTATDCAKLQPIAQAARTVAVDGSAAVVSTVTLPDTLTKELLSDAAHLRYKLTLDHAAQMRWRCTSFEQARPTW